MMPALSDAELLARLVGFDSTSCHSNVPVAEFICDYLNLPNVEITRNFNDDRSKVNLIVRCASGDASVDETLVDEAVSRSGLILSGHLDVVPAGEPDWRSDPFTLTETPDAYVGRGACDMKGFVALAVNSLHQFATRDRPARPLVLILTFDEEPGTLGAQHLAQTWNDAFPLPSLAIIGEPTSLRAVRMHKGHVKMRATATGRSAHSGYPHLGVNAIEPMGRVIDALVRLRRRWETERVESSVHFPETPFVALNVGTVCGGSAVNIVPASCTLEFGFRPLPGMNSAELIEQVREALADLDGGDSLALELPGDSPPLLTPESSTVYQALCKVMGQTETVGVSYASDAGPLSTMGIECVVWGPGTIEVAHKPNESMPKGEFVKARTLLDRVVNDMCVAPGSHGTNP